MKRKICPMLAPCKEVLGPIKYLKTYTTCYKKGGYRVKFHGVHMSAPGRHFPATGQARLDFIGAVHDNLGKYGYTDVAVAFNSGNFRSAPSCVITAKPVV